MDVDSSDDDDDEQEHREMEEEPVKESEPQVVQPAMNLYEAEVKKKYTGHRNARYVCLSTPCICDILVYFIHIM